MAVPMTDYTCHAIVIRDGRRVFCHRPAVATTRCYYPAPFTLGYCDEHRRLRRRTTRQSAHRRGRANDAGRR